MNTLRQEVGSVTLHEGVGKTMAVGKVEEQRITLQPTTYRKVMVEHSRYSQPTHRPWVMSLGRRY